MVDSTKLTVWRMVREAIEALEGNATNVEVRDWILQRYPETNPNSVQCQIIGCTVNHNSRIHYQENNKPRMANGPHDFLFRPERGKLELFDPDVHGQWQIIEGEDGRLTVCSVKPNGSDRKTTDQTNGFAAEAHLRDYLAQHLDEIEEGLEIYVDDADVTGVEYATPVGRIDILAIDAHGGLVVIELKVGRGPDAVAGQILRYKNWVKCHLAAGRQVRGIIIAQHVSDKIRYAIANDPEVSAREYQMHLTFVAVPRLDLSSGSVPNDSQV